MLKRTLTLAIYCLFFCEISFAQQPSSAIEEDAFFCKTPVSQQEGERITGQAQAAYSALHALQARFTQRSFLAALDHSEVSSGEVWFLKQGRMKWQYQTPEPQTFLVQDHTLWLYQPQLNQVIIDQFDKLFISDLPVAFLLGMGNIKEDFLLLKACRNTGSYVLELEPRKTGTQGASEQLKRFVLRVSPDSYLPAGARVFDAGGNTTSIVLDSAIADPASVKESMFIPAFPGGTDISDRRILDNQR